MLVLSRKLGERIIVDNGRIVITVVGIDRYKIRLGIEAPEEIRIDREEVHKEIQGRVADGEDQP